MDNLKHLPLKQRLHLHYGLMLAGAVITMLGCHWSENFRLHPVAWLGIAVMAAGLIWRILFIKCPHCGDGLYSARSSLKHCPNCGKELGL